MPITRLPNYLRRHRKRDGFTQEQLAYLLGCRSSSKVSRYERFLRVPNLETALACEAIFHVPTRELFAGIYQRAQTRVLRRSAILARRSKRGQKLKARSPFPG